jgi:GNAT superfamily N-acetyltransferase
MDLAYDYWRGDGIAEVIPSIARFRKYVLQGHDWMAERTLSQELTALEAYFGNEATIIVANDCGNIVGYIGIVATADEYPHCAQYDDGTAWFTEGPMVHPDWRGQGVASRLITEALDLATQWDVTQMVMDPTLIIGVDDAAIGMHLMHVFQFEKHATDNAIVYTKYLTSASN